MFGPQASQLLAEQASAEPSGSNQYDWNSQQAPASNELDLVFVSMGLRIA
jgi:hypothetical protein